MNGTTIHYFGLDIEDMSDAMKAYAQYQNYSVEPKTVQNINYLIKSGQSGIRALHNPDDWFSILVTHTRRKEKPFHPF
jgi:hypothetical protein